MTVKQWLLVPIVCACAIVFGSLVLPHNQVNAASSADTITGAATATSYTFITQAGGSYSRMARRALQLHSKLSPAQAMYCEDVISRAHGSVYLEVGQPITLQFSELDACANDSQKLTTEQTAAWQAYADNASFELDDIQPLRAGTVQPSPPPAQSPASNSAPAAQPQAKSSTAQPKNNVNDTKNSTTTANKKAKPTNWTFWILLATSALIMTLFIAQVSDVNQRER